MEKNISTNSPKVQASLKSKHSDSEVVVKKLQHQTGGDMELLACVGVDPNTGLLGLAFAVAAMGGV